MGTFTRLIDEVYHLLDNGMCEDDIAIHLDINPKTIFEIVDYMMDSDMYPYPNPVMPTKQMEMKFV